MLLIFFLSALCIVGMFLPWGGCCWGGWWGWWCKSSINSHAHNHVRRYATSPSAKTFSQQSNLPRLPIPSLQESTLKYLASCQPFFPKGSNTYAELEDIVKDFIAPGGLGTTLQDRLIEYEKTQPVSEAQYPYTTRIRNISLYLPGVWQVEFMAGRDMVEIRLFDVAVSHHDQRELVVPIQRSSRSTTRSPSQTTPKRSLVCVSNPESCWSHIKCLNIQRSHWHVCGTLFSGIPVVLDEDA